MSRTLSFIACLLFVVSARIQPLEGQAGPPATAARAHPRVIVVGVNGAEWDIILPLLLRGKMPNLAGVIANGVYGKLRTVSAPNCPKVYTVFETGVPPDQNGIPGFVVGGVTASTSLLKAQPLWSILSENHVTVGMANVPATFPVRPVSGYMISGMLTRGKNCEDGLLCSPKLSEVHGGRAVYPPEMAAELEAHVGDFWIDCARMPNADQLAGREATVVHEWLSEVGNIREMQRRLFDYLLTYHPTDFTFFAQSCEDRVGHWLYPIQPFNVGYDPKVNTVDVNAFPNQYPAFDQVLGTVLKHVDQNTTLFVISDHGIKPLREKENHAAHMDHGGTTPIIAKHDFEDGDDVPGLFVAMGPGIRKGARVTGLTMSVFDIAPTLLHIYGVSIPPQMRGRVLTEIFESATQINGAAASSQ
jgi:predicted AlkP superfamily phosphohydrolase/phosphomutase